MAQLLILTDETHAQINALREYAENNPLSLDELKGIMAGRYKTVADRPEHTIEVPVGVVITYSLEYQQRGLARHVSVSVNGRLPSPGMMMQVIELLRFKNPMESCMLYMEPGNRAMNVLEFVEGETLGTFTF